MIIKGGGHMDPLNVGTVHQTFMHHLRLFPTKKSSRLM